MGNKQSNNKDKNNTDNTKMAHETNMAINKAKSTLNEKIIYLFE